MEIRQELLDEVHLLGQRLKQEPCCREYREAERNYLTNEELNRWLSEFNACQTGLSLENSRGEDCDEKVVDALKERINELYDAITGHPAYADLVQAKATYEQFLQTVQSELQYAITGQRPCVHDCSACGGCG